MIVRKKEIAREREREREGERERKRERGEICVNKLFIALFSAHFIDRH